MIDDEQYSSFKFDGDGDEEPNSEQTIYQEEAKDRRVEKLSHRVTIISILIPVLIGVVFYIPWKFKIFLLNWKRTLLNYRQNTVTWRPL
jgi:hypothetical protein